MRDLSIQSDKVLSKSNELITISADVYSIGVDALIDTGATLNYISYGLFLEIQSVKSISLTVDTNRVVRVANNSVVGCRGEVKVLILIDDKTFLVNFLVLDTLMFHMILGLQFCKENLVVIDTADSSIHFKDSGSYSQVDVDTFIDSTLCCTTELVSIPAFSERLVDMKVSKETNGIYLLTRNSSLLGDQGLGVADGIVEFKNGHGIVALANLSAKNVQVKPGLVVGRVKLFNENEYEIDVDVDETTGSANESVLACVDETAKLSDLELIRKELPDLNLNLVDFNPEQVSQISHLILTYRELFGKLSGAYGNAASVEHRIDVGDARPIHCVPYRAGFKERETIDKLTQDMLQDGVIRPSVSPWASPVVLVAKKDGQIRFCIDYRRLNAITVRDVYPLPRIDDCLSVLHGNLYFSSLDLLAGYWQARMAEADKAKTAFVTHNGLFEFNVMPFGLTNAPATFQRYMDVVLAGLKWKCVLVYLDDICIFSRSFEEHLLHLNDVFERLKRYNLRLKASKCHLFQKEFKYLGHIVSVEGVRGDPDKIKAIVSMPSPTSVKQVRSFVGKCNYYRELIPNYAKLGKPLYELLKLNNRFEWGEKEQKAFEKLKEILSTFPIVCHPNYDYPFKVQTDASDDGIGAVLTQSIDGKERIIKCTSRVLQPLEQKWCPREKEGLAIVFACEVFRPYILHTKFVIETDHESLSYLRKAKAPARLVRWALKLSEFDYTVEYRRGSSNSNADALSRLPLDAPGEDYEQFDRECGLLNTITTLEFDKLKISHAKLLEAQRTAPELQDLIRQCEQSENENEYNEFKLEHDLLYFMRRNGGRLLVIPLSLVESVLHLYHNEELTVHLSVERLYQLLRNRFFWEGMSSDIKRWVNACLKCNKVKTTQKLNHGLLVPIVVKQPFEMVGVDIVGPFTKSEQGYSYVLVCIDLYTSWVEAAPLRTLTAVEVMNEFFKLIICRHGCPMKVLSDRGKQFESKLFAKFCKQFNIIHVMASAYHHQTNGKVERFNKFLENSLALVIKKDQSNWCSLLDNCIFTYRVSISRMLDESPFYLIYGRDPILPADLMIAGVSTKNNRTIQAKDMEEFKHHLYHQLKETYEALDSHREAARKTYKQYYDKGQKNVEFNVEDLVMVRFPVMKEGLSYKLLEHWKGPYQVVAKIDSVTYRVRIESNNGRRSRLDPIHVQRLKLYKPWIAKD